MAGAQGHSTTTNTTVHGDYKRSFGENKGEGREELLQNNFMNIFYMEVV